MPLLQDAKAHNEIINNPVNLNAKDRVRYNINRLLKATKTTRSEFGKAIGVNRAKVVHWLMGNNELHLLAKLDDIATFFNIPTVDLLTIPDTALMKNTDKRKTEYPAGTNIILIPKLYNKKFRKKKEFVSDDLSVEDADITDFLFAGTCNGVKFIFNILKNEGRLTKQEIWKACDGIKPETIKLGLIRMRKKGIIIGNLIKQSGNKFLYRINRKYVSDFINNDESLFFGKNGSYQLDIFRLILKNPNSTIDNIYLLLKRKYSKDRIVRVIGGLNQKNLLISSHKITKTYGEKAKYSINNEHINKIKKTLRKQLNEIKNNFKEVTKWKHGHSKNI